MSAFSVSIDGKEYLIDVADGRCQLRDHAEASVEEVSPGVYSVILDGKSFRILASREGDAYAVLCGGIASQARVDTERSRLLKKFGAAAGALIRKAEIHAPMPALVVRVEVTAGQSVQKGDGLVILEAMKMENELKAPHAGTVKKVLVAGGSKVEKGELLLLLE